MMDGSSTSGSAFGSIPANNDENGSEENAVGLNDIDDVGHLNLEECVGGNQDMKAEDRESDGQRRTGNMDDDGGSFFEASAIQNLDTVVRKGEVNNARTTAESPVASGYQEFLNNEIDGAIFDPAKKLNFDDTTEDEDDDDGETVEGVCLSDYVQQKGELVVAGMRDESMGKEYEEEVDDENSDSGDGSSGDNYLDHRPRVNGSDLVEDGAVPAAVASTSRTNLSSVPDQGQNVRIIEGHDSSLQDDDGNPTSLSSGGGAMVGGGFRFNGNFLQAQVMNIPSLSTLQSGQSHDESEDDDEEDEDGQNLYDSLDPEDGTSPYSGPAVADHQGLDPNTSEYYSAASLLSMQTAISQQSHVDGDGESFWPQQELGESSHLRRSMGSSNLNVGNSFQQESFSSSNNAQSSPISNIAGSFDFQPSSLSHAGQNYMKDNEAGCRGDCGDIGPSLISSELEAPQRAPVSQDGFELCDEGLLHGTQLYAQPICSSKGNQNFDRESDILDTAMSSHKSDHGGIDYSDHQSSGSGVQFEGEERIFNMNGPKSNNRSNIVHAGESRPNWDGGQSHDNSIISGDAIIRGDERQAAAGSSNSGIAWNNQNQSAKPRVARSGSGPRKRVTATAKVQQTRRPAVQGSASREANNNIAVSASGSTSASSALKNPPPGNSSVASSASGTSKSGRGNSSSMLASSTVTNSVKRITAQSGDSAMVMKIDNKIKSSEPCNNSITGDDGCRLSGSGAVSIDTVNANSVTSNTSKFLRPYQPNTSSRPSSSYVSMTSVTTAANNRVSGVGKESHNSHGRASAQSSSGPMHSQSRTDIQNKQAMGVGQVITGSHSSSKQLGKGARAQSVPSSQVNSNVKLAAVGNSNSSTAQAPSSHISRVSSYQDLCVSVNSDSVSSSHSLSHNDIMLSSSSHTQQPQQQQHRLQQQRQHQQRFQQQQHYRQEFPNHQQQQIQMPVQSSNSNPFIGSPQSPLSPSGSDHSHHSHHSHHSYNREAVVTQMDALQHRQSARIPLHNAEYLPGNHNSENGIPGMEEVRGHLNSMLNMAADRSISGVDQSETATELLSFDQPVQRQLQFDLDSSTAYNGTSGPEDMSEILENFPTFSSKMFTEMSGMAMPPPHSNKSETQAQGENVYLRDNLEKERYRRKHCEQQIQKLNAKLLETQQQLAVAVSTDKRKDLMIEQLDKQLARVVEGWKKREADKDCLVSSLTEEKEHVEECLHRQQEMINNFERDLSQTVAELKEEKEKSSETIEKLRSELTESRQTREEVEENLASAADKCSKMAEEWDSLTKAKAGAEKLAQQTQDTFVEEENKWKLKESDLINKITHLKEANEKVINLEKVKLEEEKKKREDLESECGDLKTELKKIILDTEQLMREKESQKVEMSIMEAKFESAQRKLEADLHAQMEKEIAEQAREYHSKLESAMEELSEKHRKQVGDLHIRHQQDLEKQMASANEEMDRKDAENKRKVDEVEEKLAENRNEISNLKQSKLKLESQRMEILSKLQFMMQSQWNEAVSLLVSTPQKKGLSNSFLSNQSMSMSGMLANAQASQSLLNTDSVTSSVIPNGSSSIHSSNDSSSLGASLDLASLVMAASAQASQPLPAAVPQPSSASSSSCTLVAASSPYQQSTTIPSTSVTTNPMTISYSPPGQKRKDCNSDDNSCGSGGKTREKEDNRTMAVPPLQLHSVDNGGGCSASDPSSYNDKSVSKTADADAIKNKGIYTVKGTDMGGAEILENLATMDKVEDYVFRTAIRDHPKTNSSPQGHELQQSNPVSSQSPLASMTTSDPDNSLMSAIVHHPSVPTSGFKAVPIQSPRQKSSSLFWNDLDNIEQGSQAPPPSASTSYHSMHQHDSHPLHTTAMVVHNNNQQMLQQQQFRQQQQRRQHQDTTNNQLHHSQPPPNHHHHHHQLKRQQQQQQRKGVDMSPPVRQPAMSREDLEDSIASGSSGVADPIRLQADYSHLTDQVDAHMNRQEELQHYIQMLLKKAPGTVEWEPENESMDILESSRDLTEWGNQNKVDLDLTETGQALEVTRQLGRLQELRERQKQVESISNNNHEDCGLSGHTQSRPHSVVAPPSSATSTTTNNNNGLNASFLSDMGLAGTGGQVLTPQNLVEISQLLSLYRDQWESSPESATNASTATQLMDALSQRRTVGSETRQRDQGKTSNTTTNSNTNSTSANKHSPRGQPPKRAKSFTPYQPSSSLSSSTSSANGTKDTLNRNRRKVGQNADSTLNSSTDSGHHHNHSSGGGSTKSGPSGRKGQGSNSKGGPPISKSAKASSGLSAWK